MTILRSLVQIAVDLDDTVAAQNALDTACPGDFDVTTGDRTLMALSAAPAVGAFAVGQGPLAQADYAMLATMALAAGINHAVVGVWVEDGQGGEVFQPAQSQDALWEAMGLVPVEYPEE